MGTRQEVGLGDFGDGAGTVQPASQPASEAGGGELGDGKRVSGADSGLLEVGLFRKPHVALYVQPMARKFYKAKMGGVDKSDQLNGYYASLHRSCNYFWRRLFEQKAFQAASNP